MRGNLRFGIPPRLGAACVGLVVLMICAVAARAQNGEGRPHFQMKFGVVYDQDGLGTPQTSRILYAPITFRYLGDRFDLSVTPSFARTTTPGSVEVVGGAPVYVGDGIIDQENGIGDTVVRARVYLHEQWRTGSGFPSITPFFRMKLPTVGDGLNLGTGRADYGFGLQWDKQMAPFILFGDVGYTIVGKDPGLRLGNRPDASIGLGARVSPLLTVSGLIDWRQSIYEGYGDLTDLVGIFTFRLGPDVRFSPNVYIGLTDRASDFGVGAELSYRFGRY